MSVVGRTYRDAGRASWPCPGDEGRPAQLVRVLEQWVGRGPRNVLVEPVGGGEPYVRPFRGLRRPLDNV